MVELINASTDVPALPVILRHLVLRVQNSAHEINFVNTVYIGLTSETVLGGLRARCGLL